MAISLFHLLSLSLSHSRPVPISFAKSIAAARHSNEQPPHFQPPENRKAVGHLSTLSSLPDEQRTQKRVYVPCISVQHRRAPLRRGGE